MLTLYALREMKRTREMAKDLIPNFNDYFVKNEDGSISMDERIVGVIDAFGSRIAQSLKMSFLQGLGADAKIEKGLTSAMAQDFMDNKIPLLSLAADFMGINTKEYISKHPGAIPQLVKLAAPYLKGLNLGSLGNDGATNQGSNVM